MIRDTNRKIGIVFPSSKSGGVLQYVLSTVAALVKYVGKYEYCLIHYDSENPGSFLQLDKASLKFLPVQQESISFLRKIIHFAGIQFNFKPVLIQDSYRAFKKAEIDLLIFPTPFTFDLPLDIPYIVSIPDLMYKYYPNSSDYHLLLRIKRDIVYKYFAKNAVLTVVDSEQGFRDLAKFFNIKKEKIRVIPFVPPEYVYRYRDIDSKEAGEILKKFSLPEQFIFYPAAFWAHKNHLRLIQAIHFIKSNYNLKIHLVLVGSFSEKTERNYNEVMKLVHKLNLKEQVRQLGFVSDKEVVALYKKAVALIFPTLIGPTSIPPLEAMVLGTPVLCSNLFEMPKQIGDAGLTFNPFDVKDMAEKIHRIWTDKNLRQELVSKGYDRVKNLTLANYAKLWEKIIKEAFTV